MNMIVAVDNNLAIGYKNQLLCSISEDKKYFKKLTDGKAVIMGRKTYESIGKSLQNRKNYVLTRDTNFERDFIFTYTDKNKLLEEVNILHRSEDIFVIGGAEIYKLFFNDCDMFYITKIDKVFKADSYFPALDLQLISESENFYDELNDLNYRFCVYKR